MPLDFTRRDFLGAAGHTVTWAGPLAAAAGAQAAGADDLAARFQAPGRTERPWVYWWWLNGNVTRESITHDLEAMRAKGVGGFLMFDSRDYGDHYLPPPKVRWEFLSKEWLGMLHFAIQEAARLGLQVSANLSTNGGTLRAPWQTGDDAPKKLVWTAASVEGPGRVSFDLRSAGGGRWEVALLAVRETGAPAVSAGKDFSGEWRALAANAKYTAPPVAEVVDLTAKVDSAGRLAWDAPQGRWTLLRFSCEVMSDFPRDVDILNRGAVTRHFERFGRPILQAAGPLAGKTFSHFYNVSWEGSAPTWTPGFEKDFQRLRGYDPRPLLPALAGYTVRDADSSRRFVEDFSRTLGDCFMLNCYGVLGDLCHKAGVQWHSESGGPWVRSRETLLFDRSDQFEFWGRNDMPQGEFWVRSTTHTNCLWTAMAAHIYGKRLAAAEAFTSMGRHWSEYPAMLKPQADAAFADGANHFIWHIFDASPAEFGRPGIVYWAGTHLNPNVTWWEDASAFLLYLARCQAMLRTGDFIADVCVYRSDRNYNRWGRESTFEKSPLMDLGRSYRYDLLSTEALAGRMAFGAGALTLPGGMRYKLLAVDLEAPEIPLAALRKVVELARAGATVVLGETRPTRSLGFQDAAAQDAEVRRLASELWGEGSGPSRRPFGKGLVLRGVKLGEALRSMNVAPDFEGPGVYTHRRTASGADIYFVTGQGAGERTFRVTGKTPELWDPVTGQRREALECRATQDGRTAVKLTLPEQGSLFVVFRKPAAAWRVAANPAAPGAIELASRTDNGARVRCWSTGRFELDGDNRRKLRVAVERLPEALELAGPWDVRFPPRTGAPATAAFDRLSAWNEHATEGVRHFSGTATYRITFDLDAARARGLARLELGVVHNIARVRLNGAPLGVVWTAPWSLDVTGKVKAGRNTLEVDVTNLWVNRLIGDAELPEEKRITRTIVRRTPDYKGKNPHLRGYVATDTLEPSGLLGPVKLLFGVEKDVQLE
jgi:hypothetical protein